MPWIAELPGPIIHSVWAYRNKIYKINGHPVYSIANATDIGRKAMIKLASIGHVLLRVADEEASKRFYRDALGFRVAEQDPEHGGVFMTLGDGFHTLDIIQHPVPIDAVRPGRGQLGLVHIAFKVDS